MAALQAGQGLPEKADFLSPMLERAVLLIFFSAITQASSKILLIPRSTAFNEATIQEKGLRRQLQTPRFSGLQMYLCI
jgi:hypothetical protein